MDWFLWSIWRTSKDPICLLTSGSTPLEMLFSLAIQGAKWLCFSLRQTDTLWWAKVLRLWMCHSAASQAEAHRTKSSLPWKTSQSSLTQWMESWLISSRERILWKSRDLNGIGFSLQEGNLWPYLRTLVSSGLALAQQLLWASSALSFLRTATILFRQGSLRMGHPWPLSLETETSFSGALMPTSKSTQTAFNSLSNPRVSLSSRLGVLTLSPLVPTFPTW